MQSNANKVRVTNKILLQYFLLVYYIIKIQNCIIAISYHAIVLKEIKHYCQDKFNETLCSPAF